MTASISFAIDILKERKKLENQDMVEIGITEYLEQVSGASYQEISLLSLRFVFH